MRILVISRTPWRKDNSFGNTYSNYFGKMERVEIANLYMGDGLPDADNRNVTDYFRISEKETAISIFKPHIKENKVGCIVYPADEVIVNNDKSKYGRILQKVKKNRWSGFFLLREMIWKYGQVDYDAVLDFVSSFSPDIVFVSFYYAMYVDRIALRIQEKFGIPMVLEAAIDIYSLKQISFDPLFWVNRFLIRSMIRKTVRKAEKLYVISEKMRKDYSNFFKIDCDVLYKSPDLSRNLYNYQLRDKAEDNVFLYTGNIYAGRWKTLGLLGKAISDSNMGRLVIYTASPLTNKIKKALAYCDVHSAVSQSEVIVLQNAADVLVHTESFKLKDKLEVRYSISTKIMDYISCGRCILAIGPKDIASMEYLKSENLAVCVTDQNSINESILELKQRSNLIIEYSENCKKYVYKTTSSYENLQGDLLKIAGIDQ